MNTSTPSGDQALVGQEECWASLVFEMTARMECWVAASKVVLVVVVEKILEI